MMSAHAAGTVDPVADCKGPLKGKGQALGQWHAEARQRMGAICRDMAAVAAETRAIEGRRFALHLQRVRGGHQLRWRHTSSRQASWPRIEPTLPALPPTLAHWYRLAHQAALILNHREQAARYELKTIARLLRALPARKGAEHP